ncbi:MAG: hypothetical protein QOK27_2108 [Gemmatimonadales bacterium]|nr:hypothetical protein [Gemmatimonadales bacterium]
MSVLLRLNRRGATLPLGIIVLAVMSVAVAITYARITAERHTSGDLKAQLGAFAVAQTGLSRYMAALTAKPPATHDTTMTDLLGGTALISLRMLRESTTTLLPAVYVITSRGSYTAAKRYNSLTPSAQRTVATYALWVPTPFDLNGAFTSLSGIDKTGNSGALDGNDNCLAAVGGGQPAIPGVAVPNGTYTGAAQPINGNPDDTPHTMGTGGTGGTAKDSVGIDWAGIVAGTKLPPDYLNPAWPTAAQFLNWPVSKTVGDLNLPSDGKGILIVTGNLIMNGSQRWDGLILVGGSLSSNGNNVIEGAVITGLNVKLGVNVPQQTIANGNKTFQYDSCNLARALGHIGSLQRVRNGWTDTWSSY